jgi:hypothetical protein
MINIYFFCMCLKVFIKIKTNERLFRNLLEDMAKYEHDSCQHLLYLLLVMMSLRVASIAMELTSAGAWSLTQFDLYLYSAELMCSHNLKIHLSWVCEDDILAECYLMDHNLVLERDKLPSVHENQTCTRIFCHGPSSLSIYRNNICNDN